MPSRLSLWMQADPRTSSWLSLIVHGNSEGIEARIAAAKSLVERRSLLCEGIQDCAWFGSRATVEIFLRLGAPVDCLDKDGRTPLLRSIERNHDQSAALALIENGANVNAQDYAGRTPLMQCIWRNRMRVFDTLLEQQNIDVELKDGRGRNALHHLAADLDRADEARGQRAYDEKTPHNQEIVEGLLHKSPAIWGSTDEYNRTCLHWAASHGNSSLVELFVRKRQLRRHLYDNHAFSVADYQRRSPIHIAAAEGHFDIVTTMLVHLQLAHTGLYCNINDRSVGDWTILLLTLRSPRPPLELVQRLVQYGADVNICTQDGKNALHYAALHGSYDVIKFMLHLPEMQRSKPDAFGDTPLQCAARYASGKKDLRPEQRQALLLLFAPWTAPFRPRAAAERAAKHQRPVVHIFDKPDSMRTDAHMELSGDQNMYRRGTWREMQSSTPISVYDLIYAEDRDRPEMPFIPTVSRDNSNFKWVHLPANSTTWCLDLVSKHFIERSYYDDMLGLQELGRVFAQHERHNNDPRFGYMEPTCVTISISRTTTAVVGRPPDRGLSMTEQLAVTQDHLPPEDDAMISSMFLFMPFLQVESTVDQIQMCYLAQKVLCKYSDPHVRVTEPEDGALEHIELLRSHNAYPDAMTLQLRRTLHQFYYQNMDTKDLDIDQVFQRCQLRTASPMKTLMVDQLWMIVLSDELIVTCCPGPWNAPAQEQSDMVRRVIDYIGSNNDNEIYSVWELAILIAGQLYGSHPGLHVQDMRDPLSMYKTALDDVKAHEVKMSRDTRPDPLRGSVPSQAIANVREKTIWLQEVKDIADEVGILGAVFALQDLVQKRMQNAYEGMAKHGGTYSNRTFSGRFADHRRSIEVPTHEILQMVARSTKIEKSLLALLELKEKHTSALQANSSATTSTILLIFTIVTIVFLPLTFIASFFTMPLSGYPKDDTGAISLPALYVVTYVFGIGMPIATALVTVALFADWSSAIFYEVWHRISGSDRSRSEESKIKRKIRIERTQREKEYHLAPLRSTSRASTNDFRVKQKQKQKWWREDAKTSANSNGSLHGNGSIMTRRTRSPSLAPGPEIV